MSSVPQSLSKPASGAVAHGPAWSMLVRFNDEQGQWFAWLPILVISGIALYFYLHIEPALWLTCGVAGLSLFLVWFTPAQGLLRLIAVALLFIALGFAAGKLRTEWVRAPVLDRSTGLVEITALVERLESQPKNGARLTLLPFKIADMRADQLPKRVRVRVAKLSGDITPGSFVSVSARLSPPPPPALPGGFDFARHAWFQSIGAVGYALKAPVVIDQHIEVPLSLQVAARIQQLRQTIATRIRAILPGQNGAIAVALVTGERGGISDETNDIYRDSGLFHVLSISGMHMAIMAGTVFFLVRLILAAIPAVALRFNTKKWAAIIAAVAALGYLTLSGGAFATVRSYIMISVMFAAVLVNRPALALRNVAMAALIIVFLFPESVLDPGFQMSFAAVTALVSVYEALRASRWGAGMTAWGPLRRGLGFFIGIVISTLVAGLAVAPFAAYHFHNTQHLAVVANLVAMPVSNLIIMPAALGVMVLMPFGMDWPATVAMGFGIELMSQTAEWVAGVPGAVGKVPSIPVPAFLLIVFGGLWLLLWRRRWRYAGVLIIAAGLALTPFGARPDIIVGNRGKDVLVRGAGGELQLVKPKRRLSFAIKRWLEADGQKLQAQQRGDQSSGSRTASSTSSRLVDGALTRGGAARCDAVGCVAKVKGLTVAAAFHPSALHDDCKAADVVIFNEPAPKGCTAPQRVIDFFDVYYGGTHTVTITGDNSLRVTSVAEWRGVRPWTKALPGRERAQRAYQRRQQAHQTDDRTSNPDRETKSGFVKDGNGQSQRQHLPSFDDDDGARDDSLSPLDQDNDAPLLP